MKQIAFMAPTQEQYRQAILSTFLTSKNVGIILSVFVVTLMILFFVKFLKSVAVKVLFALLVAGLVALYLYLNMPPQMRIMF